MEVEYRDDQAANLIFIGRLSRSIDLTGAGGTLPPSKPTRGSPADPHLPGFRFLVGLPEQLDVCRACPSGMLRF